MELDQALQILNQVCARIQGTLADHQQIQTALQVVAAACTAETAPEPLRAAE
jgi:hypothetical protein